VPDDVRKAALTAPDRIAVGARLAELIFDSYLDSTPHDGMAKSARLLHFRADEDELRIVLTPVNGGLRLAVSLVPAASAGVEIRFGRRRSFAIANEYGRFVVDGVTPGLISIVVRRESQAPVQTTWVKI
jgi:hypothetical protein